MPDLKIKKTLIIFIICILYCNKKSYALDLNNKNDSYNIKYAKQKNNTNLEPRKKVAYKVNTNNITKINSDYINPLYRPNKTNDLNKNMNIFYVNGKKFFYEYEKSPTDQKLNNFCFVSIDGRNGKILYSKNANEKCYPASLTKLMTLYILFENLSDGRLSMNSRIYFSNSASMKQRMKLNIKPGDSISVYEAIHALIILSANDVAAAVSEKISGSEYNFSKLMTIKAKKLGMNSTSFSNPSGLFHPNQKTTPLDLIKLGIAIRNDFPEYYHFFSKTQFIFRGRMIHGHNAITRYYPGAEGLKTGFVKASGYNIVSSASRGGKTIFAAVMGASSKSQRDQYMKDLLDKSFKKASRSSRKSIRDYALYNSIENKNQNTYNQDDDYFEEYNRYYSDDGYYSNITSIDQNEINIDKKNFININNQVNKTKKSGKYT
jgi:D-alanyl-D-alanine carboxypeptidase (penicillin-binding protein 5/6)